MTPETRRLVFRYGIAIDLVILATGVGMFLPRNAALLLFTFAAAVLLSAWKGGWQGGVTAVVLSLVSLAAMFDVAATPLVLFAAATGSAVAALAAAMRTRVPVTGLQAADVPLVAPAPVETKDDEKREAKRSKREQREEAKRLEAEHKAAERARAEAEARAKKEREEAERVAREKIEAAERARLEAEARAKKEREEAERIAREKIEAAERERARLEAEREAAERARLEAEARAKKEREEAERIAREQIEAAERARLEAEARAKKEREEAERAARESAERMAREQIEAAERARLEAEARANKEREEAERERARLEAERARLAAEREAIERARAEAEARVAAEREELERLAREREEAERERARLESERAAAEKAKAEAERLAARDREEVEREMQARIEAERRAAEEKLQQELATAREAMQARLEEQLAAERETLTREADARVEAERKAHTPPASLTPGQPKSSILDTVSGWFRREEPRTRPNLNTKRVPLNDTASRRAQANAARRPAAASAPQKVRKPRIVLLEKRRGTADTVLPKLRQRGIEVTVVERWVDAVDEMLRVKPDAFFLDLEHPDFEKALRITAEKTANLPIVLTGRDAAAAPSSVRYAAFAARPYDLEEIVRLAQQAMSRPDELLAMQTIHRAMPARPAAAPARPVPAAPRPLAAAPLSHPVHRVPVSTTGSSAGPMPEPRKPVTDDEYEVPCFSCRADFNAVDADWCSCLAKERTLVCTNCLSCFCKAPPAYKEKFWVQAPPRLFERKTSEGRRGTAGLPANPAVGEVTRPLVLTVEDDEEIQAIVHRVCSNLGYGFIHATNGQDGLEIAREYRPNLILSDAFMPKLDGREMCRMLKEEPEFADTRMVIMTGLYTDTKYRSEAVKRFHVDDYVAKPVAVTDLINILQRHLEGVSGLPVQDDLHELHRREIDEPALEDVPLSDVLAPADAPPMQIAAVPASARSAPAASGPDAYDVCCFNCEQTFDAAGAEWCRCVGRDNTLSCAHCGGCFCKAPAPYKERFWMDAPPSLFERKMIGSKRNLGARTNPPAADVKRPLILLVEDDENVQLIVRTVVTTMGYGFVVGANGQEGLSLAREYSPDLILSDAFMPKLDGREMCRLLKEDPTTSRSKAIIMTGLYTDRKYRNEALDYFKVDDYVAKPLAVDDLIKLFKKHLPHEVATAH